MVVGLFVPCYINVFYPRVGVATLQLFRSSGIELYYPGDHPCCGQPLANSGFTGCTRDFNRKIDQCYENCDYVVVPSGSCALHLKLHGPSSIRDRVFEITEFLIDVIGVSQVSASFPFRVGLHNSCHGQRGLGLSSMSELRTENFSKPVQLLHMVKGLTLVELDRADECCGFGGTFCVTEEAVSVKMGKDRVNDHLLHQVDYITSVDSSCLMHLEGIIQRQKLPIKTIHIAQILAGRHDTE